MRFVAVLLILLVGTGPRDSKAQDASVLLTDSIGVVEEKRKDVSLLESYRILEFEETTTWIDVHRLTAPPGAYFISVEFETETGAIVGFHRSEVDAPDRGASGLATSDILLAYAVEEAEQGEPVPEGFIQRNDLIIQPAPWGVFRTDQPLYFYLEAYNLTIGTDDLSKYAIEAALVEKKDEGGLGNLINRIFGRRSSDGVSVRFEGSGTSAEHGQYLILDATEETPGTYVLVVRFTDAVSGDTVEKRRVLILE
ncbi:MAG: hypothetical protein IIA50_01340 [Bacteroidetes bacterium]|nr:hypothetical protein [Bacteroidota bacterium]